MINKNLHNYYLKIAKSVAEGSTCHIFKEGAVLVDKNGTIISSGHNGAVHGYINCFANGCCTYEQETGQKCDCSQERCAGLHAEVNAILNANREETPGSVLYVYAEDRQTQKSIPVVLSGVVGHMIQAANIKDVITKDDVL